MKESLKASGKGLFNTIYVEKRAYGYDITRQLLNRFGSCPVVPVKHYKDVFNRPNQHFDVQKQHPSLILAVKDGSFLYRGPDICQDFGYRRFFYSSFLLNCIFDCEYCYLQGMYPSANIVAFVNTEDFLRAMDDEASNGSFYLAASYDTDLIAFHNIIPYPDYLYDFLRTHRDITAEIRTKSANREFYENHEPMDNIIIAFTVAPQEIIRRYERHTPSLEARIKAIQAAMERGFKVRLCFDPVFINPEINELYEPFYDYIFSQVDPAGILDVGYGFFRMPKDFFKRIEKRRINSLLYCDDYCLREDVVSYPPELQNEIREKHIAILSRYIERDRIFSL